MELRGKVDMFRVTVPPLYVSAPMCQYRTGDFLDFSTLATACRDYKLRLFDLRASNPLISVRRTTLTLCYGRGTLYLREQTVLSVRL